MISPDQEETDQHQITQFKTDARAVTPVIGIILLVALAVILGAIIGTFGFGLADTVQDYAPSTQFDFTFASGVSGQPCGLASGGDTGKLEITHAAGDKIEETQLTLVDDEGNRADWNDCASNPATDVSSGDKTLPDIDTNDTVKILWESENKGGDTAVLATYEGPDA